MIIKLLKKSGQSAVVSYWDYETGMTQARVISIDDLPNRLRIGQEADISNDALQLGIEYGIDWELLLGQSNVHMLAQSLRNHGIWTVDDMKTKPQQVIAAINSSSAVIWAELLRLIDSI